MNLGFRTALERDGFAFVEADAPRLTTAEAVTRFGTPLTLPGFATIQSLRPKHTENSTPNTYSGNYGRGVFPLHTDLAHWVQPPRFVLLRCVAGVAGVATLLLDGRQLISKVGTVELSRTLVQPRRPLAGRRPLLRLLDSRCAAEQFLRWDSLFIAPATPASSVTYNAVSEITRTATPLGITLASPGDTLVVDNWRMLHGRSQAPEDSAERQIDRVYLDELREER